MEVASVAAAAPFVCFDTFGVDNSVGWKLGHLCMDSPVPVGSSMPQGDPASPLWPHRGALSRRSRLSKMRRASNRAFFLDDRILDWIFPQ